MLKTLKDLTEQEWLSLYKTMDYAFSKSDDKDLLINKALEIIDEGKFDDSRAPIGAFAKNVCMTVIYKESRRNISFITFSDIEAKGLTLFDPADESPDDLEERFKRESKEEEVLEYVRKKAETNDKEQKYFQPLLEKNPGWDRNHTYRKKRGIEYLKERFAFA